MPHIDAVQGARPLGQLTPQQLVERENARLLAALIRALPAASNTEPQALRQMLSDPVKLSLLVRHAGLHTEVVKDQQQASTGLQTALAKVAPQHIENLLATLDRNGQPAFNMDETYGEPAGLRNVTANPTAYSFGAPPAPGRADNAAVLDVTPFDVATSEAPEQGPFPSAFPMPPVIPQAPWRLSLRWPLPVLALIAMVTTILLFAIM